jgi:Polysaccharide lyase
VGIIKLRYDRWFHFLVHARWSTGSDGFVEMWLDGKNAIRRVYGATLRNQTSRAGSDFTSPGMYLSHGTYRHAYRSTNTVIHDGFRRAPSRRPAGLTEH